MKTTTITLISNIRARLDGDFDFEKVSDFLAYHPPGYQFAPAYKRHVWDGYVRLFTASSNTFPAGLAWMLEEELQKQGQKVVWVDERVKPDLTVKHTRDITLQGVTLYPWQAKAIRVALARERGVLKMATGAGKTETMAGTVRCLESDERPPKTLIFVPNRNLLMQTKKRLEERLGFDVGSIGYGQWNEDWVTVAIPDTYGQKKFTKQRKHLDKNTELLMLDECHHTPSQKWSTLVNRNKAYYRLAFSGSPLDRGDGSDVKLMGATGPLILDIPSSILVAQGKLAKPTAEFIDIRKPKLPAGLAWEDVYSLGIVRNQAFHDKVASIAAKHAKDGKRVLVLVTRIDHGNFICDSIRHTKEWPRHRFVHGKTDPSELERSMERFTTGNLNLLVASPIFGEGTDLPSIDVLIIADGGKSVIKSVQKAGRAMRPKKGKPNECTIFDFAHFTHPKLFAHSLARAGTYMREGFVVNNAPVGVE